ncbi:MAG: chromate transporter [Oscillospiraceae bacterium]|nr:chromate transporter [Oscillospiraceae bacterium]
MIYLQLFWEFFKTGLFAIGGGMATIPFLYDLSDKTHWFSHNDLANMIAVGESTPGPIGVNMATYVGYVTGMEQGGILTAILGAVVATLGLITPSVIVIMIVAAILKSFRNNRFVNHAFYGLRPASTGLIAAAGISVIASNLLNLDSLKQGQFLQGFNWKGIALAMVLWVLTNVFKKTKKLHPIIFIGFAAVIGIIFQMG